MQTVSPNQLFELIDIISKVKKTSNNANVIRQILYDEYGIDSEVSVIEKYLNPTISELETDSKIIAEMIGYNVNVEY